MILTVIGILVFFQILVYVIADDRRVGWLKTLVLGLMLTLHFFVLPSYFYPTTPTDRVNCGLPALGVTLGFWIVGGGMTLLTHFIYPTTRSKE